MPSKSKGQQRLFGAVVHCQETGECASEKIKKIADEISPKAAKDFARSTHKKGRRHMKEGFKPFSVWLEDKQGMCKCGCKSCKEGNCKKCSCKDCKCENCKC